MEEHRLTLKLPDPLMQGARELADGQDITVAQLVRDLLGRELARQDRAPRGRAESGATQALRPAPPPWHPGHGRIPFG